MSRSRVCNRAAQGLAAFGVGSVEGEEHLSCNIPDCVSVIVVDDLSTKCNEIYPSSKKVSALPTTARSLIIISYLHYADFLQRFATRTVALLPYTPSVPNYKSL